MKHHGQISRELCWVKKSKLKRLHIWFLLYNTLEMTKLQKQKSDNWLPKVKLGGGGAEGKWMWLQKSNRKAPQWWWKWSVALSVSVFYKTRILWYCAIVSQLQLHITRSSNLHYVVYQYMNVYPFYFSLKEAIHFKKLNQKL